MVALAILGLFLVLLAFSLLKPEPVYQGRRVSAWIRDLADANEAGYATADGYAKPHPAREALAAMGSASLPYLTRVLARSDSRLERSYAFGYSYLPGWIATRLPMPRWNSTKIRRESALLIQNLSRASPDVVQVVPALTNALGSDDMDLRSLAVLALVSIAHDHHDQTALGAVTRCLGDPDPAISGPAIQCLADGEIAVSNAVPVLRACLTNSSVLVRIHGAFALYRMTGDVDTTVPVLVQALGDTAVMRQMALMRLAKMGSAARSAGLAVCQLTNDPVPFVRQWARVAMQRMGGEVDSAPGSPSAQGDVP